MFLMSSANAVSISVCCIRTSSGVRGSGVALLICVALWTVLGASNWWIQPKSSGNRVTRMIAFRGVQDHPADVAMNS